MKSFLNPDGKLVVERKSWTHPFTRVPTIDGGGASQSITEPYRRSVWVMRAIKYVADPISSVPLTFYEDRRSGEVQLEDPDFAAFWERPAATRCGQLNRGAFIAATAGFLKLLGNAFWIMDDTWLAARRMARSPLILAHPSQMRPILDDQQQLVGWTYRPKSGRPQVLVPDQVEHLKTWNPYDDILGLAEWEAAKIAADADYQAGAFARNLMANNGDQGPIVIGRDGNASDEQIAQITAMLREKRLRARAGEFVPAFLTGDITVEKPGIQAVDAAYVAQRIEHRHEIFLAFGVPPSFADVTASYSVGSASDRFKLIEETCQPLAAMIADSIEAVSARLLGRQVFAEFDWDEHSTMQQVRAERFESAAKAIDRGMPWREASKYFRLRLPRFAGDDVGRVPFNLVEIGSGEDGGNISTLPPEPEPDPAEEDPAATMQELFKARAAARQAEQEDDELAERDALWRRVHRDREPWEKRFLRRVQRHLFDARKETLENIAAAKQLEERSIEHRAGPSDLVFELTGWVTSFVRGLAEITRNAIETAAAEAWSDLGRDDALTLPADETLQAVRQRENMIKDAGEKIHERIRKEIEEALLEGETMDAIADRVRASFQGIDRQRARTIATTETTVAYEVGRDMTFRAAGVEWTQWVSAGDERVRHTHRAADGQTREMGEPFEVNGFNLAFPGDPEGPPSEVINCRCVRIALSGPDTGDIIGNDDDGEIPF